MNKSLLKVITVSLFLISCGAPRHVAKIEVPALQPKEPIQSRSVGAGAEIFINEFTDAREDAAIADFQGKPSKPDKEVAPVVEKALISRFQKYGFLSSETAALAINGSVVKWIARITGGVPANVDAEAAINIEVLDPANKVIYSGTYEGFANARTPNMSKNDVRESLNASMLEAINQIFQDRKLLNLLSSF